MLFRNTLLSGLYEVRIEPNADERGFFARSWCREEFQAHELNAKLVQCNISFNKRRGTLRGMHFQAEPFGEAKLIRCTQGGIYDVAIDLRPQSPTFRHWVAVELTAANHRMLFVPQGFAHGFLTLEDNTEVFYQMSDFYKAEAARGVRWDDPAFQIAWPAPVQVISERDRTYPDFTD
jgi:dTDP-4-dehydrorhamnose 3,5-epimerase